MSDTGSHMHPGQPSKLDRLMAWPMFVIALLFLLSLAAVLQFTGGEEKWIAGAVVCAWTMLGLHILIMLETVIHWYAGSRRWRHHLIFWLLPPLRIACRDTVSGEFIWLPWMGWKKCNEKLQDQVESHFSIPMIFVALLILPLLAIKQFWKASLLASLTLRVVTDTGETIVWLAFAIEFIFMITIVDKKVSHCVRHWLDIFVICVPFLAFVRLARLGTLFRISQVSRLARAYRLRGLALRLYRSLLLLNIIERVLRLAPERRLKRLQARLKEKEEELVDLKLQIEELKEEIVIRAEKRRQRQELKMKRLAAKRKQAHATSTETAGTETEGGSAKQAAADQASAEKPSGESDAKPQSECRDQAAGDPQVSLSDEPN